MKVLYFNRQLGSFDGGASHAAGMLAALRSRLGHTSVAVAPKPQELNYSHRSYWLKRRLGRALDAPRVIRRDYLARTESVEILEHLRSDQFKPDVVVARSELHDGAPRRIADELGCALVLEVNTPFELELCDIQRRSSRWLVRRGEQRLLSGADGIYVVSNTLRDLLSDSYGMSRSRFAVIPNGYSNELYADFGARSDIRDQVREASGLDDAMIVTFVGSLQDWHGVERLVEIAEHVRRRPRRNSRRIVFWVIGDGPRRDRIKSYADSSDDFFWHGSLAADKMKRLLYASDLGIMPYDNLKRFYFSPLKMFDMIGSGLPFIGLNSGQISELATDYLDASFLVAASDPHIYAERIQELAHNPDEMSKMSSLVTQARGKMTWDSRCSDLIDYMRSIR